MKPLLRLKFTLALRALRNDRRLIRAMANLAWFG